MGVNINGEKSTHLIFADDIVLIADSRNGAVSMLEKLYVNSQKLGLKINMTKTEIMTNLVVGGSVRNIMEKY